MFGCLFLIGQEIWLKFSYNSLIANPSAFQNGMTLENRVKIGRAMSKNARTLGGYLGPLKRDLEDSTGITG